MRISQVVSVISLAALAGCAKADAASLDPGNDFDCAVVAGFFREMARVNQAPDHQRQSAFILYMWYATKWQQEHPGTPVPQDRELSMESSMLRDPAAYKPAFLKCVDRATADPVFDRFASLVVERKPDAR